MDDAIVIGGGPAGLQAALTLGRMHRTVRLLDSGEYRNGTVAHAQNLITNDGRPPAELRDLARAELAAYPTVTVQESAAASVAPVDGGFSVETADGMLSARTLILATGLRDELPPVPGLSDAWGLEVAHCPFCHGHEFAGGRIGILGTGEHVDRQRAMLAPIGSEVVVWDPADVVSVARADGGLVIGLADGRDERVAGLFVAPVSSQRAPFAAQLGLRTAASGCVEIDVMGRTSRPGVYAAGDMAQQAGAMGPTASIAFAIASGQAAAAACVFELITAG
jgi:thioredoxin reductase